ncbi:hypothetical protein [Bifidobacterium sp. SO1]|uniref:hypothetical protein n=1 Tax=Bifidobacterium sp. SO1 TaxID=2809029 RepID=UPI001BDC11B9|nr:hypothetical protein [Bifidobacterium sp. SO1]MBT1161728.1 hypothetical protein [Bifidobacterium sp. SO1]
MNKGILIRLYRRNDPDEWDEFVIRGFTRRGEPVNTFGEAYPKTEWMEYRSTGYREADGYGIITDSDDTRLRRRRRLGETDAIRSKGRIR